MALSSTIRFSSFFLRNHHHRHSIFHVPPRCFLSSRPPSPPPPCHTPVVVKYMDRDGDGSVVVAASGDSDRVVPLGLRKEMCVALPDVRDGLRPLGYGKRVPLSSIFGPLPLKGIDFIGYKFFPEDLLAAACVVGLSLTEDGESDEQVILVSEGTINRIKVRDIPIQSRYARGVSLIQLELEEKIISISLISAISDEDTESESDEDTESQPDELLPGTTSPNSAMES